MPARASSSATISFGLVSIPVKLYAAIQPKSLHFNLLDRRDKSRVKQQYVNPASGEVVPREEMVKGYEYARGQYVVLTEQELASVERKSDHSIEIEEFVPIGQVDPLYFEKANLLGPDKGGQKAYRLLVEAMTLAGRVAIGRHATRGRQQLVLIRPLQRGLVLHGLYYADEVRSFDEIEFGDDVTLKANEVELAGQLVEQLSRERFDARRYEDEYRAALLQVVDRKVAGEEVVIAPKSEPREQIIDLVAALKKSLAERGSAPAQAERVRKPARAKGKESRGKRKAAG
jgi:DNA end-binding protein Ku